jgi:hypothetical protein
MWWEYLVAAAVVIVAVYGFSLLTGFETRMLSRRTDRSAESMYGNYADSARKQRRHARNHGGSWHDGEDGRNS